MKNFRSNAITNNNIVDNLKNILFFFFNDNKQKYFNYILKYLNFHFATIWQEKTFEI